MSKTTAKTIAETIDATFCTADSAKLFNKGFERVIEASKATLDLAAAQNADLLDVCKNALKSSQAPVFVFDLVGEALTGQRTLQKSLVDRAVLQSASIAEAAEELLQEPSKAQAGITKLFQQSLDRTMAAHDSVLE